MVLGAVSLGAVAAVANHHIQTRFAFPDSAGIGALVNYYLSPLITLGYAALVTLMWRAKALGLLGKALSAVGRMAFTNYIAQTLIMTVIFWGGRGPVLFAEIDRPGQWAIVIGLWLAQLIWSPLWLSRFEQGPLEWVWRKLSKPAQKPAAVSVT
jgi:uncharacterized protein